MANGLDHIQRKPTGRFASDPRHNFVKKIMEMYRNRQIERDTPMVVAHRPTCNIFKGWARYCDCDAIVGPKITH